MITKRPFGTTKSGLKATLYTLENKNGMKVSFTDYGACVVEIWVPDREGKMADVVLGFPDVTGYDEYYTYYGAFVGRNGNRIANASFTINGKKYDLEKNDGPNNLHSGFKGYNNFMYEVETFDDDEEGLGIEFSRLSPDMEQGFPGNLDVTVTYTLTDDNALIIDYLGVCDKDTVMNFTNHSFFNLGGHDTGSIEDHEVWIDADKFTPTDDHLIPTGELRDVTDTPMDFRIRTRVGDRIDDDYEPLKQAGGYDHNYVLNISGDEVEEIAEFYDPASGRSLEVYTDLPGLQFYAGNFISGKEVGKNNCKYIRRGGACFETQFFPDACNPKPGFDSSVIKAFEEFETVTVYKFAVRDKY